jgi:hypothetical protein
MAGLSSRIGYGVRDTLSRGPFDPPPGVVHCVRRVDTGMWETGNRGEWKMARMSDDDRRLILQAEEAALDHGSVDRVFGKRASTAKTVREAIEADLTSQEEEAALDQGAVGQIVGQRRTPLLASKEDTP